MDTTHSTTAVVVEEKQICKVQKFHFGSSNTSHMIVGRRVAVSTPRICRSAARTVMVQLGNLER